MKLGLTEKLKYLFSKFGRFFLYHMKNAGKVNDWLIFIQTRIGYLENTGSFQAGVCLFYRRIIYFNVLLQEKRKLRNYSSFFWIGQNNRVVVRKLQVIA